MLNPKVRPVKRLDGKKILENVSMLTLSINNYRLRRKRKQKQNKQSEGPLILLFQVHRMLCLWKKTSVLHQCKLEADYMRRWGGLGGGRPGEKGAGGVREAGEEGAGSWIPKVAGSGRKREKLCNITQLFAIEKMQRGGSQKIQGGNRD